MTAGHAGRSEGLTLIKTRKLGRREGKLWRNLVLSGLAMAATGSGAKPAAAQFLNQYLSNDVSGSLNEAGVTVLSRRRSDYESGGIRAGSYIIRPQLTESAGYQSNVLGSSRPRGSPVVQTSGSVDVNSDVSRATVSAGLTVDDVRFVDLPRQSYTNWSARLGGSYDVGRDIVSASYQHLNINQTVRDLDVPQQLDQSLSVQIDSVRLGYQAMFSALSVTPALEVSSYSFSSGTVAGSTYQQSYRNRILVAPSVTAAYQLAPRRNIVLVVRDAIASYTKNAPGLARRDYNDLAVLGGLDYDATSLIRFRVLVGYEIRIFDVSAYKTIQSPIAEASAVWTPTGLTTVTGSVARRIQDSADETTAGYTQTSARLRVDHEYLRNVLLQANAGVYLNEYNQGGGSQTLYAVGTSATYLLNRNVGLTALYDLTVRPSSGNRTILDSFSQRLGSGNGYVDNRALLQLRFSL